MTGHSTPLQHVRIWSGEHSCWWRADARGYTTDINQAGIYTRAAAEECTKGAGPGKMLELRPVEEPLARIEATHAEKNMAFEFLRDMATNDGTPPRVQRLAGIALQEWSDLKAHQSAGVATKERSVWENDGQSTIVGLAQRIVDKREALEEFKCDADTTWTLAKSLLHVREELLRALQSVPSNKPQSASDARPWSKPMTVTDTMLAAAKHAEPKVGRDAALRIYRAMVGAADRGANDVL